MNYCVEAGLEIISCVVFNYVKEDGYGKAIFKPTKACKTVLHYVINELLRANYSMLRRDHLK